MGEWQGKIRRLVALGAAVFAVSLFLALPDEAGASEFCAGDPTLPPPPEAPTTSYLRSYRAPFGAPTRLAIDSDDNVYATDPGRGQVVVRTPDGKVIARPAGLGHPSSIAVDDVKGRPFRIYLGDSRSGRVTAYKSKWRFAFELGQGAGEFLLPTDIAIEPMSGNVYVTDAMANLVKVYSRAGAFLTSFGGPGELPGLFNQPVGLFIDADRNEVLVADQLNCRVQFFDLDGAFICEIGVCRAFFGEADFDAPQGLWVDTDGRVYVSDASEGRVRVVDRGGNLLADIGAFGERPGELRTPLDLVMDTRGRLFVAANNNARLEVFGVDLFVDPEAFAPAVVEIQPDPFDPQGSATPFAAQIQVPGYRLDDIDVDSIRANGVPPEPGSAVIDDRDNDGEPELTVTFDRDALAATLPKKGAAEIVVQGQMAVLDFDGIDVIEVAGGAGCSKPGKGKGPGSCKD